MQVFDSISAKLGDFIREQKMFFVASATDSSRINLSPKGLDSLRIINPNLVVYLDYVGSGNETAAHLLADGRLTMMFCSFGKKPLILRLFGQGRSVYPGDEQWSELIGDLEQSPGQRKLVALDVDRVQTSCGFGVPIYEFVEERPVLNQWIENKGEEGVVKYRLEKNTHSIDGLETGDRV